MGGSVLPEARASHPSTEHRAPSTPFALCTLHFALVSLLLLLPSLIPAQTGEDFLRVLTLRDYNTRVVLLGATLLGVAGGLVGTFLVLRKRALLSDALSHAMLPGVALAFIVAVEFGRSGKSLPILLFGATVAGLLGLGVVLLLQRATRLKEDVILALVLSTFFGLGISLLTIATRLHGGEASGLKGFIYGKTASMLWSDAMLIAACALVVILVVTVFFKEFVLLCFDSGFAGAQGWPVLLLDVLLMGLVVLVTVIGLQAVGLILMVALLVIPPSAARFWTDDMKATVLLSALFGGASGLVGAALSAVHDKLPAGAIIVLVASGFFAVSMVGGRKRGLAQRFFQASRLRRTIGRQHLLRAVYEAAEDLATEQDGEEARPGFALTPVPVEEVRAHRSWSPRRLSSLLRRLEGQKLLRRPEPGMVALTPEGVRAAEAVIRTHRLWEIFLITHADVAPSHVDTAADAIEHVLDASLVAELERALRRREEGIPLSPHPTRDSGVAMLPAKTEEAAP